MRILLVHPSVLNDTPQPPLGIAYIASYLHSLQKHEVRLIDFAQEPPSYSIDRLRAEIKDFKPQIVGISFLTPQYRTAMEYFKISKSLNKDIWTVAGGIHASSLPSEVLSDASVDFIVCGEGEITMAELADTLSDGLSIAAVKGLGYRKDGAIRINPARELMQNLDSLPRPFWSDLSKNTYKDMSFRYDNTQGNEVKYFPVLTSRGCPNNCNFCAVNVITQRKVRFRDPENVFNEIMWLYNDYDARYFQIIDDTATVKRQNMLGLCHKIINSGLKIKWGCKSRVNTVDPELLDSMRQAGCCLISFGVESGDPGILKKIGKNITLDQVKNTFSITKKAGITTEAYFMVGNLGETWSSVNHTIEFIKELEADYISCSITVPFPGTEIYKIVKSKGWLQETDYSKFNAAFHFVGDPLPIMRTEDMTQADLLKAYYKVNGSIVMKKMRTAYGDFFYFNPTFFKREILFRICSMGIRRLSSVLYNLLVNMK